MASYTQRIVIVLFVFPFFFTIGSCVLFIYLVVGQGVDLSLNTVSRFLDAFSITAPSR